MKRPIPLLPGILLGAAALSAREEATPRPQINCGAADPSSPSTVYAAGSHNGVWKTTDAGADWSKQKEEGSGNGEEE